MRACVRVYLKALDGEGVCGDDLKQELRDSRPRGDAGGVHQIVVGALHNLSTMKSARKKERKDKPGE